jgi:hypothetical protein
MYIIYLVARLWQSSISQDLFNVFNNYMHSMIIFVHVWYIYYNNNYNYYYIYIIIYIFNMVFINSIIKCISYRAPFEVEMFLLLSLRGINLLRKEQMAPHESGWIMTTEPYATLLEWWFMYDLFRFVNDHFLFGFMLGFIQEMGFALTAVWVWCSTW